MWVGRKRASLLSNTLALIVPTDIRLWGSVRARAALGYFNSSYLKATNHVPGLPLSQAFQINRARAAFLKHGHVLDRFIRPRANAGFAYFGFGLQAGGEVDGGAGGGEVHFV